MGSVDGCCPFTGGRSNTASPSFSAGVQDLRGRRAPFAAGTLIATITTGDILAAPLVSRFVDRWGVRPAVVVDGLGQTMFFVCVPFLDYRWLLLIGFLRAFAPVPTNRLARQALSTLVPERNRRTALAMGSIGMEVAMMIGPALAVLASTHTTSRVLFCAVAAALFVSAVGWFGINPQLQVSKRRTEPPATFRRGWLNRRLMVTLLCSVAAGLVLAGTDIGIVASARELHQLDWPVSSSPCGAWRHSWEASYTELSAGARDSPGWFSC